ncbi:MAG: SurA N-terminal domain-containing protein [Paracoccaceae bacterium]
MLELIRRGVKSWVAKALLLLLIASFAVWGIGDVFSFSMNSPVAEVGDQEVTAEELSDALNRQRARLSQRAGRALTFAELRQFGIGDQVLGQLVRDAALTAELRAMGLEAPDAAVAEAIRNEAAFQGPNGDFSRSAYESVLAGQGLAPAAYEALRRTLLGQELLLGAVAGAGAPPPGVAARFAAHEGERRRVAVLRLGFDDAEDPGEPTTGQLETYLAANEARFREPERKYGRYLHLDIEALAETVEIDESTLVEIYEARKPSYTTEASAVVDQLNFPSPDAAEAARARLDAGEADFAALVEEAGETPESVALGRVTPAELPTAAAEAVFDAGEPGVVGPVETLFCAALLRVESLTEAEIQPFEAVRDEIAERERLTRAYGRAPELAGETADLRAAGASLEEIAETVEGARVGTIEGWAANGGVAEGETPVVLTRPAARGELSAALDGEERDLVELDDGGYLLVAIDRIEPARVPALSEIEPAVAEAWRRAERLAALDRRAETIAARVSDGEARLDEIAAEMERSTESVGPFTREGDVEGLPVALVPLVFAVERGEAARAETDDGAGVVVAEVVDVLPLDAEEAAARAETLRQALSGSIVSDQASLFARAVQQAYGARIDREAVERVFELLGAGERAPGS